MLYLVGKMKEDSALGFDDKDALQLDLKRVLDENEQPAPSFIIEKSTIIESWRRYRSVWMDDTPKELSIRMKN